jgi:hypothetical protein
MELIKQKPFSHYYGDIVRIIFVIGAGVMLWGMPRITEIFQVSVLFPIIAIAILGIAAGITNPVQLFSLRLNVVVSLLFLIVFAYLAWYAYVHHIDSTIELTNQVMAIMFLAASYFSIKSFRGAIIG